MDTTNLYAAASSDGPMRHNARNADTDSLPYGQVGGGAYGANQKKNGADIAGGDSGKMTGQTASGHPNASKAAGQASPGQQQNTIGHYVLVKALGEGTFGKVKLGTHILTGEKVAVKVLEKSRIKEKKDVERISREIKILKQLHHPNVVQIYEIIETEQDLYLVMEFVQGGELFDLIVQNQRLKERQACKYFQELISGINYIHQLGICHRDLKPENLLIDYDQSLKIVDFGLSNLYEQGTTLKTACGSPCYAAPEMIAGKNYNGLMSDLWSCGVVLYAMLCGYLPFEDQKTSDLYKKILNAEYTPPDFLSPEAKDMIAKIFVTEPSQRIDIDGIRKHPWYQQHRPETMGFHVCPPAAQRFQPPYIVKNNKKFTITQRFNLLNQKIIGNLEAQQGFNKESLLKSIKNNKHNHLTATYYLLLKKHMIRQLRPYSDAFMELKPYEEPKDPVQARDANKDRYGNSGQQPPVQLKSNKVQEALQQKRGAALADSITITERQNQLVQDQTDQNNKQENNHNQNTDEKHQPSVKPAPGVQANADGHDAQKEFRSLDHNQMAEAIMGKQQAAKIDSAKNLAKRQNNYMDGGYNDYVDSTKQYSQVDKGSKYGNQQPRDKQSSRLSNRSSHGQDLSQQDGKTMRQDEMNQYELNEDQTLEASMNPGAGAQGNNFNGQTQQSFAKKPKASKNAFNHRREYSANPYIGNEAMNQQNAQQQVGQGGRSPFMQDHKQNNMHMEQYQTQIDKYKKAGGPMQPQPTKTRNSRWKPQDSSVNNTQSDMSSMRSQNTKLHKKSQESIKNNQYAPVLLSEENHPGTNPHQSDLTNQLVPTSYQTQGKPRAQSYNIKRRGDNSGSLDPLEYEKEAEDAWRNEDQNQYQQIKSTNFKQATKGHHREVRAPSSGSSGSQPRVVIAGPNKEQSQGSGGQLSVNSSGVQRRYDSIEHQRQSQIDRFLQSPQEQIANMMMIQKLKQQDPVPSSSKFSKKNLTVSSKDNHRKNASETFNQGGFSNIKGNMPSQGHTTTKVQQQAKNAHPSAVPENISIQLTNLKHKKISQNAGPSQKKLRNNSKGNTQSSQQNQAHDDDGGPSNRYQTGPIQNMKAGMQMQSLQQQMSGQSHTNYRQIQHQLALLNPKKDQLTSDYSQKSKIDHLSPQDGVTILQQQYSSHFQNNIQQSLDQEAIKQLNLDQNMLMSMQQQKQAQKDSMNDGAQGAATGTTIKGNHRKAKSQLNQPNGAPTNGSGTYQHQKVQQIKMQDGSIRNLIHQIANNNGNSNQQANSSSKTPLSTHQAPSGSSKHAVMPMPSAPKSGNVIKLKHQVIRNKSSQNNRSTTRTTENFKCDRGARGNSQTLQNTGSSNNQQQTQIMLQQQLQGKKKILHTTKNTSAGGQNQHNFDIVEAAKEAQATHQASVQHTSAIAPNSRKSQQTAHSIKIGATSGASIGSNFSKFTGNSSNTGPHYTQKFNSSQTGVNVPKSTGNQETFLRSLMKEYEKSQHVQQFQMMQNKDGDGGPSMNTQIVTSHGSAKHSQQHQGVPSTAQGNKRGAIKVQKIQKNQMSGSNNLKANQIENIHKQISQNQKTLQNMTQGLFSKNNTGTLMMQGSASQQQSPQTMQSDQYHPSTDAKIGLNQQQIMVVKLKQKESRQNQVRGANGISHSGNAPSTAKQNAFSLSSGSSGVGMHNYAANSANVHSTNYSQQSQQTSASRRYSHQEPSGMHPVNASAQSQQNPKLSQHPKIGHYQTQDNRLVQGNPNINNDSHGPSSQGGAISTQQSYTGASFHQNTDQGKVGPGSNAIGNIEFSQNFGNGQFKYPSKQGSGPVSQGSAIQSSKQYRNSGSMKLVKGPPGPAQNIQKGYQTQNQNSGMSSASNTHQQMSIMNKYNKQQMFKQGKMTAQETRGDRSQQVKTAGQSNTGPQRHYSAPREAAYGPIDDDELRRQHLLNQSLDMSQLNGIGNAALQSAKNYTEKQSSKQSQNVQKINLGKLSQNFQVQNIDKNSKDQHHGQGKGHSGW